MNSTLKKSSNHSNGADDEPLVVSDFGYTTEMVYENDPNYKATRTHNNTAIDDYYKNLMRQSNHFSLSAFQRDMIDYQARSRAEACRAPEAPVVVHKILPGEEEKFLNNFLNQITPIGGHKQFLNHSLIAAPTTDDQHQNMIFSQMAAREAESQFIQSQKRSGIAQINQHRPIENRTLERNGEKTLAAQSLHAISNEPKSTNGKTKYEQTKIESGQLHSDTRAKENEANPVVFFEIQIDEEPRGRIVMELFKHVAPKTAENFRQLCTRNIDVGYNLSYFHRIIPGFMCQGGDFEKSDGTGGFSIYGGEFDDENFDLKHDRPFLLSMANSGPNTNGSQFFITFTKCPHLDGKHVVFGQVLKGFHVFDDIEICGTDAGEVTREVKIVNCGQIE